MSQEELAKKVGYTDRSSIAKIENGDVDLPQSKIMAIAKALDVSAGALMGWEDSPEGTAASSTAAPVSMDPRKNAIDHYYPNLSDESKDELLKRCVELVKLDSMNAGSAEVPRRSLDYDDSASIA